MENLARYIAAGVFGLYLVILIFRLCFPNVYDIIYFWFVNLFDKENETRDVGVGKDDKSPDYDEEEDTLLD